MMFLIILIYIELLNTNVPLIYINLSCNSKHTNGLPQHWPPLRLRILLKSLTETTFLCETLLPRTEPQPFCLELHR